MIAAIGVWVKNLIFLVLFAAFLELLLPAGSMKKFLRMVIGIFLLLAILKPAVSALDGDFSWRDIPVFAAKPAKVEAGLQGIEERRKELAYRLYKKELGEQMKKVLENIPEITAVNVEIELEADNRASEGEIIKTVVVRARMAGRGKKIKVELRKNQEGDELNDMIKNKIRQRINSLYQISEEKISFG